jgi:Tfp pilus assembly protein PilN
MEETLTLIPVLEEENRRLVLALATEEPFPGEVMPKAWRDAGRFVIVPHLFESVTGSDLILWMEWETLQMAFYRAGKVVWFCGLREQALGDMVLRSALKLLSDRVLDHLPSSVTITRMPRASADLCAAEIKRVLPSVQTRLEPHSVTVNDLHPPSPRLPERILDIPPSEARSERIRRKKTNRLLSIATAGAVIYLLLLAWGIGDLLILKSSLNYLRKETSLLEAPSMQARKLSERWNALRPAIDPSTYPLDLLAAVATPTESGKVRLTAFTLEQGRLQISGEATDVTQAYAFIEQLKKNPLLQEYDWTAGQPQLAGKNSVRFEMDGALPASPRSAP